MRLAFYAPLKSPDHPEPSGDRAMARGLVRALTFAGYDVRVVSKLRSRLPVPDEPNRHALRQQAAAEVEHLVRNWSEPGSEWRPDAWFTYHLYYKSPDWIGPEVCHSLSIPYVAAEVSYAAKRDRDAWAPWQADVVAAVRTAAIVFCLTAQDRIGLEQIAGRTGRIVDLAPFIDQPKPDRAPAPRARRQTPQLATVAMMRPGVKIDSYRMLAAALATLGDVDWRLRVVGDGPARCDVVEAFAAVPHERIAWAGLLDAGQVRRHLSDADLYVWPGFGEAYGMAYLEAQSEGLPVVAQRTGGIPSVVRDGVTGLLTEPGDVDAYAAAMRRLIVDAGLRDRMGHAAAEFVHRERTVDAAARILQTALATLQGRDR